MGFLSIFAQTEFLSAVVGAVVGGLIAAAVTYFSQNRIFKEEEERRNQSIREHNKVLARSLFLKVSRIYSNIYQFHRSIEEHFERVDESRHNHPSMFVMPIGNMPDKVHISTEELSLLLEYADDDLFNSIVSIDSVHNSAIGGMNNFIEMRKETNSVLDPFLGEGGAIDMERIAQIPEVIGRIQALDRFIFDMRASFNRDVEEYQGTIQNLHRLLVEGFDFNREMRIMF